jgi:hypothetical protein
LKPDFAVWLRAVDRRDCGLRGFDDPVIQLALSATIFIASGFSSKRERVDWWRILDSPAKFAPPARN